MKFNISEILKVDGATLEIESSELFEGLKSLDGEYEFNMPVSFKGRLINESGRLKLDGRLTADYTVKCCRCLKEMKKKLDIGIDEVFVNKDTQTDAEEYVYEGNYVEIDKALIDNIVLSLPMKQLCSEDCRGFCPTCGSNLNEKECQCKDDYINPQMEVLKKFFNN